MNIQTKHHIKQMKKILMGTPATATTRGIVIEGNQKVVRK